MGKEEPKKFIVFCCLLHLYSVVVEQNPLFCGKIIHGKCSLVVTFTMNATGSIPRASFLHFFKLKTRAATLVVKTDFCYSPFVYRPVSIRTCMLLRDSLQLLFCQVRSRKVLSGICLRSRDHRGHLLKV